MSIANENIYSGKEILGFYTEKVRRFGSSSEGVGWKNEEAQLVRFAQLLKLIEDQTKFSINDLGCGAGRFYKYMIGENYHPTKYHGYDILKEMIQLAENDLLPNRVVHLTQIRKAAEMSVADYTIASGIFNVKYEANETEWLKHLLSTITIMDKCSNLGFAFNALTKYSDKEYMQLYLYYADPLFLFDYCKRHFSKNVALLHDYFQFDFTIIVRK